MKRTTLILTLSTLCLCASAKTQTLSLSSPDGKVSTEISAGDSQLSYSVAYDGISLMAPSLIGLELADGTTIGKNSKISSVKRKSVDDVIASPFYNSDSITDKYNQVSFNLGRGWAVEFRAYNDGIAYRFVNSNKKALKINNEIVEFSFPEGAVATVPFVNTKNIQSFDTQFFNSFENTYTIDSISKLDSRRLAFLPLSVSPAGKKAKVLFTESALIDYPGMYLNAQGNTLKGVFAPYPSVEQQGGHNNLQMLVPEREDFIAEIAGPRALPWRIAVVAPEDKVLAETNLTYLLADPLRIDDISWIKPGKVAWEWWNAFNLDGVDFKTGVNNNTYKAYIDFASENGIEYIILDEGWAVNKKADLFLVVPEINLTELVEYGNKKNVGLILWAGFQAFARDMEKVCKHYSDMGIKGFKIDFLDRDDQKMTKFRADAAEMCAKYGLVLDIHGTFKAAGINRTYPNILNVEGVHGLENLKWSPQTLDQVEYDVQIPFIRQVGGPMDYTQGAMLNASKGNYYPVNSEPMSQGTRCRQLALYMILESPLNMLCDSPSNYRREAESTKFIAEVPTVWDETIVLDGVIGDYIMTARRSGDTWYIGGITDWTARDLVVALDFLKPGKKYEAEIFEDGTNAHRKGRDYRKRYKNVVAGDALNMHLAPGGGFAIKIKPE